MWVVLQMAILACCLGGGVAICVLDNKRGWNVDCGVRDSYLFRFKDYGGIKANFDFGFEVGNEAGFPHSITNTAGHHRRNDDRARDSGGSKVHLTEQDGGALPLYRRRARPGPAFRLRPPPPPSNRRQDFVRKPRPKRRQGFYQWFRPRIPIRGLWKTQNPRRVPVQDRFRTQGRVQPDPPSPNNDQTRDQTKRQQFVVNHGPASTFVFSRTPPAPQAPPSIPKSSTVPTIGPAIGEILKVDANTPADTDHVPSFAAKMFVVREAPREFYPPGYSAPPPALNTDSHVEVPRTKFFCEEQKYLPGIYADTQLGCKVFHLCVPAAVGNTVTSFLCPNMTLFDQSIMQCNWWYYVNCEISAMHYDANLPMALSYRKINAAQLPLAGVSNFDSIALLSHNSEEMKNPSLPERGVSSRMGEAEETPQRTGDGKGADSPQQQRRAKDDKDTDQKQDKVVSRKKKHK